MSEGQGQGTIVVMSSGRGFAPVSAGGYLLTSWFSIEFRGKIHDKVRLNLKKMQRLLQMLHEALESYKGIVV